MLVFKIVYVVVVPHIDMVAVHLLGSMTSSTGFVAAVNPNTMLCPVSLFVNQRVATISLAVLQQIGCPVFPGDELIGDVPDIVVPPIVNPVILPAVDVVIPPIVNPVVPPNPLADLNALPLAVVQNGADLVTEALAFISAGGVMTPSEFQDWVNGIRTQALPVPLPAFVPSSLHSTVAETQGERCCHQLNIVGALTDVSRTSLGMPYDAMVNIGSFRGMLIDAGVVSISKVDQLLTADIILLITQRDISVELLTRLTVVMYGSYDRDFLEIDAFLRILQELQLYPVSTVMVLKSFWAKVLSFTEKRRVPSVKIMKLFLSLLAAILNKVVAIASNTTSQLAPLLYERALREALDSSDYILKAVSEMVSEWDYSVHEDTQAQLKNVKIEFAKF